MPDAVVVGAGPNGLVAANLLADAGWDVLVLEAQGEPGGAVRSAELIEPGFVHDLFSAFYPLAAVSPVLQGLRLEDHGLGWRRAPSVLAHPDADGRVALLSTDIDATARSLDRFAPGDGDAWRRLYGLWERVGDDIVRGLFTPFPPVLPPLRIAAELGGRGFVRFLRSATLPVRRMAEERFKGDGGGLLLAGNALHTDLAPASAVSGFYGWLLTCLGQQVGFPVPEGGAGALTRALVQRLLLAGGEVRCNHEVVRIRVSGGKAVAVELSDGAEVPASRAILADVGAPSLFLGLVGSQHLPADLVSDLHRFHYDAATIKVDWTLDAPIPWSADEVGAAGTVHLGAGMDELTETSAQLEMGRIPARPFLVMGQMTTADPTRSPPGTETAWAYTHVPRIVRGDAGGDLTGSWSVTEKERFVERIEDRIESYAPGFRGRIRGRHVMTPAVMQSMNANLVDGAVNGGTAQLHQALFFRPVPGLGRPTTPIRNLYLASASAHPGGGVHGAPGANAARAALWGWRRRKMTLPLAAGAVASGYAARTRGKNRS